MDLPESTKIQPFDSSLLMDSGCGLYAIEEKQLKALVMGRTDLSMAFQLLANSPEGKNHYALVTTVPLGRKESHRFVLYTAQSKEIRRFKDLDYGRRFVQKLNPVLERFNTIIEPALHNLEIAE